MPNRTPVVLEDTWSFLQLKRVVEQQQRELTSTRRHLQHVSTRRHDAVWMPPDEPKVRFRNDYAGTIPAYGVCEVAAPITLNDVQVFPVTQPTTTFKRLYLVNGSTDVLDDGYGYGTWLWQADWVLYDDANTPAIGESWGPQSGSFELKKYRYGFTIWGNPSGGTTDLVMAQQQWVSIVYGQTNGAINKGSSGTLDLYDGNNAAITSSSVTTTNRFSNIATAKKAIATWNGGTWLLTGAECPLV